MHSVLTKTGTNGSTREKFVSTSLSTYSVEEIPTDLQIKEGQWIYLEINVDPEAFNQESIAIDNGTKPSTEILASLIDKELRTILKQEGLRHLLQGNAYSSGLEMAYLLWSLFGSFDGNDLQMFLSPFNENDLPLFLCKYFAVKTFQCLVTNKHPDARKSLITFFGSEIEKALILAYTLRSRKLIQAIVPNIVDK